MWKDIKNFETQRSIFKVLTKEHLWFFRTFRQVIAWDIRKEQPEWIFNLAGDDGFGYRDLVRFTNVLITSAHRDDDSKNVWLLAISIDTGQLLWERKIAWTSRGVFWGLNMLDRGNLIIAEGSGKQPNLLWINSKTGESIKEQSTESLIGLSANSVARYENTLYNSRINRGLYKLRFSQDNVNSEALWRGSATRVQINGRHLYALGSKQTENGNPFAFWLDARTSEEISQISLEIYTTNLSSMSIFATDVPHLLLLSPNTRPHNEGLALLDLDQRDVRWHVGKDQWHITNAICTPHGIVAVGGVSNDKGGYIDKKIVCVDLETGLLLDAPYVKHPEMTQLYWEQDKLLIGTLTGAKGFIWSDD